MDEGQKTAIKQEKERLLKIRSQVRAGGVEPSPFVVVRPIYPLYGIKPAIPLYGIKPVEGL